MGSTWNNLPVVITQALWYTAWYCAQLQACSGIKLKGHDATYTHQWWTALQHEQQFYKVEIYIQLDQVYGYVEVPCAS